MTCLALMHTDADMSECVNAYMRICVNEKMRKCADSSTHPLVHSSTHLRTSGFTMIELMVVIVVVSMFALLAQMHLFGLLRKSTFRAQV